jgi:serine/threonine-protein kinase
MTGIESDIFVILVQDDTIEACQCILSQHGEGEVAGNEVGSDRVVTCAAVADRETWLDLAGHADLLKADHAREQEDGTLRGVETTTILTNECGAEGQVFQVPYIATRVGDVPAGVTVSDPATVPAPSASNAPISSPGDPALQGTYRLELTTANQPGSGDPDEEPVETATTEVHAWAIHSECSATRCVATAATVVGDNNDEPTGGASVLRFVNGRWQSSPTLLAPQPCGTGIGEDSETSSFSLEPQPDGSLRGTATRTVLTDECGEQGRVSTMSIVATRVGDVPLSVVLADPALFP